MATKEQKVWASVTLIMGLIIGVFGLVNLVWILGSLFSQGMGPAWWPITIQLLVNLFVAVVSVVIGFFSIWFAILFFKHQNEAKQFTLARWIYSLAVSIMVLYGVALVIMIVLWIVQSVVYGPTFRSDFIGLALSLVFAIIAVVIANQNRKYNGGMSESDIGSSTESVA